MALTAGEQSIADRAEATAEEYRTMVEVMDRTKDGVYEHTFTPEV
jgi:hypothetical protein